MRTLTITSASFRHTVCVCKELDSATSTKIKRVLALPPKRSEETACTIYVERLPTSTTHATLKAMFAEYGAVR